MNNDLLKFCERITSHGHALTLDTVKNGLQTSIVKKCTPISELSKEGTLYSYLTNIIDRTDPDEIIIVAKQKNGSTFKNARKFYFTNLKKRSTPGVSGFETSSQSASVSSDPMAQVLQFQLDTKEKELSTVCAQRDKHERKHEEFKEKYLETKRELDLIKDKHALQQEKDRLAQENSLSSVLKEFKPEIQGALSGMFEGKNQTPQLAGPTEADPNTKIGVVTTIFNSLTSDEPTFNMYFEVMARLGHIETEKRSEIIAAMRNSSQQFNKQLQEIMQYKIK
jgi:uncharacterized membrane protein